MNAHDALAVAHIRQDGSLSGWFADCDCGWRDGMFALEAAAQARAEDHNQNRKGAR